MVMLAEKMRQKLLSGSSSQSSSGNNEKMGSKEDMQEWLLSVGIISPVTKDSAAAMYNQQPSSQLFLLNITCFCWLNFVRIPLEKAGGMINLMDIYCLFNRARGTELISPEDLSHACSLWEKFDVIVLCVDSPAMLWKFDSGAMVIQNKSHSDEEGYKPRWIVLCFFINLCPGINSDGLLRLLEDVSNAPDTAGGLTSTITCYTAWNDSRLLKFVDAD
ncbi:hypothetical protein SADUNF_Sadunf08G0007600 [Salix dunnii]|uniref:Vacuolar protein-sorting-associated protein 36 n=1 Tax=Salix dunnii TaxID=1413687 RepID=A0A835MRR5_9ROSI|nr:hypothetical protein SADUNF_Sadunf08G0007600 [Salix dunnii]